MKFQEGNIAIIKIKLQGDTEYQPVGCLTGLGLEETVDVLGTTVRTNQGGWKTSIPTNQSYNISFSGIIPIDNEAVLSYADLARVKRFRIVRWLSDKPPYLVQVECGV